MPYTQEEYEAAKARDPDFYKGADSLQHGKAPEIPETNIDKMVAELTDRCTCCPCFTCMRSVTCMLHNAFE